MSPRDLAMVDLLARIDLAARRVGRRLQLCRPDAELVELLDLAGLRIEVLGETEEAEERGVEEVVMPDDPVA